MAERVELWWARRQFSKGAEVPYPVGTYREAWAAFPALIHQYHAELNAGIVLSQVPPAADVLLLWQCEAGHAFAATPDEQRHRPGRERRRSAWCPECTQGARPAPALPMRETVTWPSPGSPGVAGVSGAPDATAQRAVLRARKPKPSQRICPKTPDVPVGAAFSSECAPRPASAVEAQLRADLFGRLALTPGLTAVRVARPFFDHVEVWPDIVLAELRVAIEYDSTGTGWSTSGHERRPTAGRTGRSVQRSGRSCGSAPDDSRPSDRTTCRRRPGTERR